MKSVPARRDYVRVSIGPQVVEDGFIGRIVQFADGSAQVQTWDGSGWIVGPVDAYDIVRGTDASRARLKALGMPDEECEGALN